MQQKIVGDIKLTPAEVRNYFSKLPQDSIPFIPTQVEVQIITQEPKISEEEIERVKSQLREYADRVNKGETSFSTLARFIQKTLVLHVVEEKVDLPDVANWCRSLRMWSLT